MHRWEVAGRDGLVVHLACRCAYCDALRAAMPRLDAILAVLADPVRPEWLGPESGQETR